MEKPPFWVDMLSGTAGGSMQILVGHPLDTVKTRLQSDMAGRYEGMSHCFRDSVREGGVRSIYRGMLAPLVSTGFLNLVLFTASGAMKKLVHRDRSRPISIGEVIVSSWMTAPIYCSVLTPIEVLKVRLQVSSKTQFNGPVDCAIKTFKAEGISGMYRGFGQAVGMRMLGLPAYFGGYEYCKRTLGGDNPSKLVLLTSGGMAGISFWCMNFPLDTLKTFIQSGTTKESRSIVYAAKYINSKYGLKGFYKGFVPCIARAFPANAVTFLTVEMVTRMLHKT